MSWEQFTTWLDKFSNNPIVVAIFSVISTFIGVFAVFSKTSMGRKSIIKMIEIGHRSEQKFIEIAKTVEAHKKEVEKQVLELKDYYEQKIALVLSIANFYEQSLFEIAELIPNAKVHAKVTQVRETYEAKKKVVENEIGAIYQDFELAVEKRAKEIESEYAKKYELITGELENIKLQIAPFQKSIDEIVVNDEYPIPLNEEEVDDGQENENTDTEEKGV